MASEVPLHASLQERLQFRLDLGGGGVRVPVEPVLAELPQDGVDRRSKKRGVEFLGVVVLVAQAQDGLEIKKIYEKREIAGLSFYDLFHDFS
jgi:hypothetical protein